MRKLLAKDIHLLVFGLLVAFLLSNCTGRQERDDSRIEIQFLAEEVGEEGRLNKKIISDFEKGHPNIRVKIMSSVGSSYGSKFLTQTAAGMAPDVFMVILHYGDLAYYAQKGVILALDDFIENDPELSLDDYFNSTVKALTYNEKIYALPKDANPLILFYNRDLFDEAGLEYPNENWTWENLLEFSRKLTRDTDGDGKIDIFGGGFSVGSYYTLIRQNGGEVFSRDKKQCLLDRPEAIEALEYAEKFHREHLIPSQSQFKEMGWWQWFASGKVAMFIAGPYMMTTFNKYCKGFEYDVALLPARKGNRTVELILLGWGISSQTKHPKESWEFVKFIGGAAGQKIVALTKHGVPCVKSVAYSADYGPPPGNIKVGIEAMKHAEISPSFVGCKEARDIINRKLESVSAGDKTVRQVIPEIVKEVNRSLGGE